MSARTIDINWSVYESIPFAVLIHSKVTGWIDAGRPASVADAWRKYDAMDTERKMLLNYGLIVVETGGAK